MRVVLAVLLLTAVAVAVPQAEGAGANATNAASPVAGTAVPGTTAAAAPATVDPRFVQAMKAYSEKRFPECIDILERFILVHPMDARVHYYLANAYMAGGKLQLAEREYQSCMQLSPDKQLQAYCQTAVSQLQQYSTLNATPFYAAPVPQYATVPGLITAPGVWPGLVPRQYSAAPPPSPLASAKLLQLNTGLLQDQEQQLKDRFALEAKDRVRLHDRIIQTQVERINQEAEDQIAALSRFNGPVIRSRSGYSRVSSSYYQAEVERIRAEAEAKIARVKIEAGYKKDLSNEELVRQNKCIDTYDDNLRKLIISDTGSVRVMPTGTCLYVRNYVNFGEDTTPQQPQPQYAQPTAVPPAATQPAGPQGLRAKQYKFKSVK